MNPDKILAESGNDDVITIFGINPENRYHRGEEYNEKTYRISQFKGIIENGLRQIEKDYQESLKEQDKDLDFPIRHGDGNGYITSSCTLLFDESGVDCKILRLGDSKWQTGRVRIRMEVEFIPDTEDDDAFNEPSLDTFREPS